MTDLGGGGARGDGVDPFETLAPLLAAATVRIHSLSDGHDLDDGYAEVSGSGFFVAPNWVLTCAHVALRAEGTTVAGTGREVGVSFGTRTVPGVVEWADPPGPVDDHDSWPAPDLALIRLLEPGVPHPCVWLTDRTSKVFTPNEVAFFGCTAESGEIVEYSGRCTIRGELGRRGLLRLGSEDEIPEGVSGGPLVDLVRGEVIGVVKAQRYGADGGLAVSVVQLRRLPVPTDPASAQAEDLYQTVMHAHDRHHADRHRNVHHGYGTWTDAQSDLRGSAAGHGLTPGRRTELLGLLAELPPPVSTRALEDLVSLIRGQTCEGLPLAPRAWRDGLGLLYGLRGGRSELEAVLRYAVHAATADRHHPAAGGTERAVWRWAEREAADAELSRAFRRQLIEERSNRLESRVVGLPPAPGLWNAGPGSVILEITERRWEPGHYDWRVRLAGASGASGEVTADEGHAVHHDDLRRQLAGPLSEAFRRQDTPGHPVPFYVCLPAPLFGLPVDDWRIPADASAVGATRPVLVRCSDREPGTASPVRSRRWDAVHADSEPLVVVVDCDDGRPVTGPKGATLNGLAHHAVPALCRRPGADQAATEHQDILAAGFGVALWRRGTTEFDPFCEDYHRGLLRTVEAAGGADGLPGAVWQLRANLAKGRTQAFWSKGITLLYDDPDRPVFDAGQMLEAP